MRGEGPESDIVMSSRVRLARNLADFPFIRKCTSKDRQSIATMVERAWQRLECASESEYVDVAKIGDLDRQFLMERQLISHELIDAEGARGVLLDRQERYSIMVNEEDHLRLQVMRSGLDLEEGWAKMTQLDDIHSLRTGQYDQIWITILPPGRHRGWWPMHEQPASGQQHLHEPWQL